MKYTRLKVKMLLRVILGTVIAGGMAIFLLEVLVDGVLQDPFARLFLWGSQYIFGATEAEALTLYQTHIRENKQEIMLLGMGALMLIAFYLTMGRFTKWLDLVGKATRQVVSESGEAISLPRELAPVEQDLRAIQLQLQAREEMTREGEQRKGDLVAFLAHDLKTPLTSVVGYLTLLADEPDLDADQRVKYTGIALEKAQRLQELLGEFFDISRMDLGSTAEEMAPIQLAVLLEQLADEFYPLFAEKNLTCSTHIAPNLLVMGYPDKLARVFDNVLKNAVSYSTPDGEVVVDAQVVDQRVQVIVTNQGLEIPEGELGRIFQKFYRLDTARSTRTGGAGLGLAIAREIVERHSGSIRAESDGKSTSFIITLPQYGGRN